MAAPGGGPDSPSPRRGCGALMESRRGPAARGVTEPSRLRRPRASDPLSGEKGGGA